MCLAKNDGAQRYAERRHFDAVLGEGGFNQCVDGLFVPRHCAEFFGEVSQRRAVGVVDLLFNQFMIRYVVDVKRFSGIAQLNQCVAA